MSKNKYIQPVLGLIVILLLIFFAVNLSNPKLQLYLVAGLGLGYTLTRSRYGFAGGIKRIYMRGEGSLSKALIVLLAITSVIFFAIQMKAVLGGAVPSFLAKEGDKIIPGTQNAYFISLATVIGGIIFGIGMMLAGGCGSGTLADFGEGQGRAFIAFIFFVIGSGPGFYALKIFEKTSVGKIGGRVYLPQYLGHWGALAFTLLLLLLLYILTLKYEDMRKKEGTYMDPKGDYEDIEKELAPNLKESKFFSYSTYHKLFVERWSFTIGSLMLAMFAIFVLVTTNKPWGVSSPLLTLNVGIFRHIIDFPQEMFGSYLDKVNKGLLNDGGTIRNIGLFFGCTVAFLLANRFKIDFDFKFKDAAYFALGGFMLGFGARFGQGCNVGAMYSAISSFSLSGWVFLISMSLGGIIGLKLFAGKVCVIGTLRKDQLKKLKK
ncbi:YeeE/YedE family protein [Helcococcus ovis]|uniref:YeeE/YedE family protein n=3 Tax=Helcococcus ovis TaxID=72026 RepID=A0A4R9C103_9FIRM|nr:YeeE/YedE family protein [Helcococcus ovis]TFF64586.1 YeeE/YedE family protein [Helcococcus ovis]TFF65396.1 YeeE/YedE family protein [Helcococcus ovis]